MSEMLLDRAGRRRSPATMPGFHEGRPPRNKGLRYPADPPKVEEIVAVMRTAGDGAHARRLRGLIVGTFRIRPKGGDLPAVTPERAETEASSTSGSSPTTCCRSSTPPPVGHHDRRG
jgi:hypothetical protein